MSTIETQRRIHETWAPIALGIVLTGAFVVLVAALALVWMVATR